MDLFQGLSNMLGQALGGQHSAGSDSQGMSVGAGSGLDGLAGMLGSGGSLNGIIGAIFSTKGGGSGSAIAGGLGALLTSFMSGGGADLFTQHKDAVVQANPRYAAAESPATAAEKATRMIRTLIYAAKADGTIDDDEQQIISSQLKKLNLGPDVNRLVQQIMNEQPNPSVIANGITDPHEAMQIYTVSCAITNADDPREQEYLNSLAAAIGLPANVKSAIENKMRALM